MIRDFDAREDVLDFRALDANTSTNRDEAFDFIGGAAFSETAGEVRFAGGAVTLDIDGDGSADMRITLSRVTTLDADNFLL